MSLLWSCFNRLNCQYNTIIDVSDASTMIKQHKKYSMNKTQGSIGSGEGDFFFKTSHSIITISTVSSLWTGLCLHFSLDDSLQRDV